MNYSEVLCRTIAKMLIQAENANILIAMYAMTGAQQPLITAIMKPYVMLIS